ncbi:transmembrane secretion effector [Frondihabitans sp. PhB188]|nr:transmembrane secretion effector [Frondihabitans sp. PhB188]
MFARYGCSDTSCREWLIRMSKWVGGSDEPTSLWRSAPFRRFWFGNAVSSFGDQITALALPFIAVTELHATPFQAGVLTASLWAPNLLALFIGTWVDAFGRQRALLVVANVAQAAALTVVPVAFITGALTMPLLYGSALMLGLGGVLFDSAYPSFFVRLVRKDQYVSANSALSTTIGVASVGGPAVAGGLVQVLGAPFALVADAVSFVVSAVAVASARVGQASTEVSRPESYRQRLTLGVAYLSHHPILRASLLASATMNLAALAIQALLVLYATRPLGLGAAEIGIALGIGAAGGLLGAVTAVPLANRIGSGTAITLGVLLNALPFLALPIADAAHLDGFLALCVAEVVSSWAIMQFDVNNNSLRAVVTQDDMRGRVSGAYSTVNYGIRPIGAFAAGTAASVLGAGAVIGVAACVGTIAVLWLIRSPIPQVRHVADL